MRFALALLLTAPLQLGLQHVCHSRLVLLPLLVEFVGQGVVLSRGVGHSPLELGLVISGTQLSSQILGGFDEALLLFLHGLAGATAIISSEARRLLLRVAKQPSYFRWFIAILLHCFKRFVDLTEPGMVKNLHNAANTP